MTASKKKRRDFAEKLKDFVKCDDCLLNFDFGSESAFFVSNVKNFRETQERNPGAPLSLNIHRWIV